MPALSNPVSPFQDFFGNAAAAQTLVQMIEQVRIPQTILLTGPEGIGKATLARRFAAALLDDSGKIERDDLSRPENIETIALREKWAADKRNDDPLLFSSHPDFVTFAPDGPLRQITIQQIRLLRERAQFKPLKGARRVFLIDHLERANEQSANSLLKILEEPPEHMVILATVENLYDLLPTIRSRSFTLQMSRLTESEMLAFFESKKLSEAETRSAISEGSPGLAASLDLEQFRSRRVLLLAALECGAGMTTFGTWLQHSESFAASRSEKLEWFLKLAYSLIQDLLALANGRQAAKNRDIQPRLLKIAQTVPFAWLEQAVRCLDDLVLMVRRNIQKTAALDAMITILRNHLEGLRT